MNKYQKYTRRALLWSILFLSLLLILSTTVHAQRNLNYQLQVNTDLNKQLFKVQGTLSFSTESINQDSVEIVLSKCPVPPLLQLTGANYTMKTAVNDAGDIAYIFKFTHQLPAGSSLKLSYTYDRGAAPTFQYYIDSVFCMASGYGSAWYPQVISYADGKTGKYLRGTGTLKVITATSLTAVMASCEVSTSQTNTQKTFTFNYTQPDIFSLYIGNYHREVYQSKIPFYTYSLSKGVDGADLSRKSAAVMDFLCSQFGALGIPNFSIIEFPQYISEQTNIGGASMLGGVLMPTDALRKFNYALFGHEISHQWWGNKILSKGDKGNALLSEAFAQYGSLQVVNHFDSTHVMDYRKTGYPGYISDQCGLGYLKNAAAGNDEPLSTLSDANDHIIGDSKGFLVLDLLSETIGKSRFNKGLQAIGTKYSSSGLTWADFLKEMDAVNGSSLQWFYTQWFDRAGAPSWKTNWTQHENKLSLTLTQQGDNYKLALDVLITYENGETSLQQITTGEKSSTIILPVKTKVASVSVDPYYKVIHWDDEIKPLAMDMGKVQRVLLLRIKQKPEEAEKLALTYIDSCKTTDRYALEFSLLYNLGRIKYGQHKNTEALAYYQRALHCVSRNNGMLASVYFRIAQIALQQKDKTLLQWAASNAIKADELNNNSDGMLNKVAPLLL